MAGSDSYFHIIIVNTGLVPTDTFLSVTTCHDVVTRFGQRVYQIVCPRHIVTSQLETGSIIIRKLYDKTLFQVRESDQAM